MLQNTVYMFLHFLKEFLHIDKKLRFFSKTYCIYVSIHVFIENVKMNCKAYFSHFMHIDNWGYLWGKFIFHSEMQHNNDLQVCCFSNHMTLTLMATVVLPVNLDVWIWSHGFALLLQVNNNGGAYSMLIPECIYRFSQKILCGMCISITQRKKISTSQVSKFSCTWSEIVKEFVLEISPNCYFNRFVC